MTPPRGLIGAALLFWGWQTDFLGASLVMATMIEARSAVRVRWDLSRADFNRISDVSAVMLAGIALYQVLGLGEREVVVEQEQRLRSDSADGSAFIGSIGVGRVEEHRSQSCVQTQSNLLASNGAL